MFTGVTSCNKDLGPSVAVIKVIDPNGGPLSGSIVRVFCTEALCIVDDTSFTDLNGESEHEFDHPAVLKVQAWKDIGTIYQIDDTTFTDTFYTLYGEGFVRLEEGDRTTEVVTVFGSNLQ